MRGCRRRLARGIIVAALAWLAACQPAAPAVVPTAAATPRPSPSPGTLYVDASLDLGPISPLVYGTNYGPWSVVPSDLMPQAVAARLTYLRFPGGNWGDQNNLTHLQIDRYVQLARQLGAETSISARLLEGTPDQAAGLVRYANVEMGYGVRYWSIGNEPSLYASSRGPAFDTDWFNREWRAVAEAMLQVDPTIQLVGPDLHGTFTANAVSNPKDAQGRDWMTEFLKANGDLVDIVSIHRYPFPDGSTDAPPTVDELRRTSAEWDETIPYLRGLIRDTTGRDLPVAVTEVNSNWSHQCCGEATPDSLYNAVWWSDVLGRLIRQKVDIVAQFALQSMPGVSAGAVGLLARTDVRPTYYVYLLYQRFGSRLVEAASDDPDVSIYAARREDGTLTLIIVNLGARAVDKPLRVDGLTARTADTWVLDAQHKAEPTAPLSLEPVTNLHLPGRSVTLLVTAGQ